MEIRLKFWLIKRFNRLLLQLIIIIFPFGLQVAQSFVSRLDAAIKSFLRRIEHVIPCRHIVL
jgi:hypothetical protein